jgi:hypothetical protein
MKSSRECKNRLENMVAFVMGELDPAATRELQEHLAVCDRCRASCEALAEEEKEVQTGFEAIARSLGPVELPKSSVCPYHSHNHFLERITNVILTHKRTSAAAAAVLTTLAACLILYVILFSSSGSAYALEQTAEANRGITSYHVKITPTPIDHLGEAWILLNPDGTILRLRMEIFSPDDGPKVSVASKDQVEVWFKMKHTQVTLNNKPMIERIFKEIEANRIGFDPKLAFEQLQAAEKDGKVQIETREPTREGQPIQLTVTSKTTPDKQEVYDVDPKTKLVIQVFEYRRHEDRWQVASVREYLDYNEPFDPSIFQTTPHKGAMIIDRIKNKVGLEQGNLTDAEIATKVAKDFMEDLIAGDFQKAGSLYEGIPGEDLKNSLEKAQLKILRVVEVGKPTPHSETQSLKVPVKVEVEMGGEKKIMDFSPLVRKEEGRWTICGGF